MEVVIFAIIVGTVNLAFFKKINSFLNVIICSFAISIVSATIFQLYANISLGHLDPFFGIAAMMQIAIAFTVGFIINLIVLKGKGAKQK